MKKQDFLNFKNETVFCECCKRELPTNNFSYSLIRKNGSASRCKLCDWIYRHNGIPKIDNYSEFIIKQIIEFVIFDKSIYVNDLSQAVNLNIDELIYILQKLNIGNKQLLIKTNCHFCKKPLELQMSTYLESKYHYCSHKCYCDDKSNVYVGKNNSEYKRIHTNCTNCGKDIEVIEYDYNKCNSYGENHNFCSQECYWIFRSKHYVGSKNPMTSKIYTNEEIEKSRIRLIQYGKDDNRLNSKIQLKVNDLLDKKSIKYNREFLMDYYSMDNYLIDYNLIIEVMGDFWHTSPLRYNADKYKISNMQARGITTDKRKHTYIKNNYGIEILYIWEHDINNNIKLCSDLIDSYINNNGVLENYHSFNWNTLNGGLNLNKNIIVPYQDLSAQDYQHLLK